MQLVLALVLITEVIDEEFSKIFTEAQKSQAVIQVLVWDFRVMVMVDGMIKKVNLLLRQKVES